MDRAFDVSARHVEVPVASAPARDRPGRGFDDQDVGNAPAAVAWIVGSVVGREDPTHDCGVDRDVLVATGDEEVLAVIADAPDRRDLAIAAEPADDAYELVPLSVTEEVADVVSVEQAERGTDRRFDVVVDAHGMLLTPAWWVTLATRRGSVRYRSGRVSLPGRR